MDYRAHYDALIERARGRSMDGYTENHHIIPRCLEGSNDTSNRVRLTPEEHFVAHLLLVKMYPGNHRLICAVNAMANLRYASGRLVLGNRMYGWVRRLHAESQSRRLIERWTDSEYRALRFAQQSELAKQRWRDPVYRAGRVAVHIGAKRSQETCARIAAKAAGRKLTAETRAKMSASSPTKGKKRDAAWRAMCSRNMKAKHSAGVIIKGRDTLGKFVGASHA